MTGRAINKTSMSWYREPWPWILIGLPASAVVAGIVTLVIAINNQDGLVAEDYYKQGLAINRVIEREARAADMGLTARMMVADQNVRIRLEGSGEFPNSVIVRFVHPTRAGEDRAIVLKPIASGWYQGSMPALAEGRWRLQIEDMQSTWRLAGMWSTNQKSFSISGADAS